MLISATRECLVTKKAAAVTKNRVKIKIRAEMRTNGSEINVQGLARWRKTPESGFTTSSISTHETPVISNLRLKYQINSHRFSLSIKALVIIASL